MLALKAAFKHSANAPGPSLSRVAQLLDRWKAPKATPFSSHFISSWSSAWVYNFLSSPSGQRGRTLFLRKKKAPQTDQIFPTATKHPQTFQQQLNSSLLGKSHHFFWNLSYGASSQALLAHSTTHPKIRKLKSTPLKSSILAHLKQISSIFGHSNFHHSPLESFSLDFFYGKLDHKNDPRTKEKNTRSYSFEKIWKMRNSCQLPSNFPRKTHPNFFVADMIFDGTGALEEKPRKTGWYPEKTLNFLPKALGNDARQ